MLVQFAVQAGSSGPHGHTTTHTDIFVSASIPSFLPALLRVTTFFPPSAKRNFPTSHTSASVPDQSLSCANKIWCPEGGPAMDHEWSRFDSRKESPDGLCVTPGRVTVRTGAQERLAGASYKRHMGSRDPGMCISLGYGSASAVLRVTHLCNQIHQLITPLNHWNRYPVHDLSGQSAPNAASDQPVRSPPWLPLVPNTRP